MQKRKIIVICLMLACTAAATLGNWKYWARLMGGAAASSAPQTVSAANIQPVRIDVAQHEPDAVASNPTASAAQPPPVTPEPGAQEAPDGEFTAVIRRLEERLTPARNPADPTQAPQDRFHHPLEVVGGVPFETLIKTALKQQDEQNATGGTLPEGTRPAGSTPADRARLNAARERKIVDNAVLRAIMRGKTMALCVLDGWRLSVGDTLPGTSWKVKQISSRSVTLANQNDVVLKHLAATSSRRKGQ